MTNSDPSLQGRAFRGLWTAQGCAALGLHFTNLALQLIAASSLGASSLQIGVMGASQWVPYLALGLWVGVLIDRFDKRRVIALAESARCLSLVVLAVVAFTDALSMTFLVAIAVVFGIASTFADTTYRAVVPLVVHRGEIVDANLRFGITESTARAAGPALASGLFGLLGPVLMSLLNSILYGIAAAASHVVPTSLRSLQTATPTGFSQLNADAAEGVRYVTKHSLLRRLVLFAAVTNLWTGFLFVSGTHTLFALRELGLPASQVGLGLGVGATGAIVGSTVAKTLAARVGLGRLLVGLVWLFGAALALWPLLQEEMPARLAGFGLVYWLATFGFAASTVLTLSLVHIVTPAPLLGRVSSIARLATWGAIPVGSLLGGLFAEALTRRVSIWLAAAGIALSSLAFLSPRLRITAPVATAAAQLTEAQRKPTAVEERS